MRLTISQDSDFSIINLPFGIFSTGTRPKRIGVAIGDFIVDLAVLVDKRILDLPSNCVNNAHLNDFIALGRAKTSAVRNQLQAWLGMEQSPLVECPQCIVPMADATMNLPIKIGDYTDFYSSIEHATNVGKMFRDPENALLPNWKHIPVGYHGRASSVVVSGQPFHRPMGQVMPKGAEKPIFQASARMDFELETGFIIGKDTSLGERVSVGAAAEYIFGMVLLNDWSARDIQQWEYVPLGPFLGKNFASSISPWVVTMDALAPFRVEPPAQTPEVLPYLKHQGDSNYDIHLEVAIQPQGSAEQMVCTSNTKYLYWTMAQQLAHHTVNGCNVQIGDLMGSGTISGPTEGSFGSLLELSWAGTKPLAMLDGSTRTFLKDFDTVIMRGHARNQQGRVGFGAVEGMLLPAIDY